MLLNIIDDILLEIISYLSVTELCGICLVNNKFNNLCNSNRLWYKIYVKHFNLKDKYSDNINWKDKYKNIKIYTFGSNTYGELGCDLRYYISLSNGKTIDKRVKQIICGTDY